MDNDLKSTIKALIVPLIFVVLMFIAHLATTSGYIDVRWFAIYPLSIDGIPGILMTIFVHQDWNHLISNSIPMLLLGSALFYYYREFAWKSLILMWILTGFWVWLFARHNYHIGASGLIYALAAFHLVSAFLRRVYRLLAFALLVVFLYGGMIWGFFPELFPERNISWESHLMGSIAGIVVAFYYRKRGIQRIEIQDDEDDEEDEDMDDLNAIWYHNSPEKDSDDIIK